MKTFKEIYKLSQSHVKVLLITACLISMTGNLSGQVNDYFAHNPQWRDSSACANPFPCVYQEGFNYYIQGDTTINGFVYKQIFKKGSGVRMWFAPPPALCSGTYSYVDTVPTCFLRSINKQMFIRVPTDPAEYLLFDWDLSVGDTLPMTWNYQQNDVFVAAIDSFYTPYGYRKRFELAGNTFAQYLLEGIGSNNGLLAPIGTFFDCGYAQVCYSLNDTAWYPTQGGSCDLILGVIDEPGQLEFNIFPNPATSFATIAFSNHQRVSEILITDLLGEEIATFTDIAGKEHVINFTDISQGVYLVHVKNKSSVNTKKMVVLNR
jgi:hypothetical protein